MITLAMISARLRIGSAPWLLGMLVVLLLCACTEKNIPSGKTAEDGKAARTAAEVQAVPQSPAAGKYKVGNPYQVAGKWYYPKVDLAYEERGIASWYGPNFHGKKTANGEIFDMTQISGAHRTLPLPSVVRVTNLENGRSLIVRLNDRGPFARGRIIDLSRRAAELLGFTAKGTALVHVRLLAEESRLAALEAGAGTRDMAAFGPPAPEASPSIPVSVESLVPSPQGRAGGDQPSRPQIASQAIGVPSAATAAKQDNGVTPPYTGATAITPDIAFAPPAAAGAAEPATAQSQPRGSEASWAAADRSTAQRNTGQDRTVVLDGKPQIFIQAGAFRQYVNANRLRARLTPLGHPVDVSQVYVTNQPFFRVRLGPLGTVEDADRALERVVALGYPEAHIVID